MTPWLTCYILFFFRGFQIGHPGERQPQVMAVEFHGFIPELTRHGDLTVRTKIHLFVEKTCCCPREYHNRKTCPAKELKGFLARDSPAKGPRVPCPPRKETNANLRLVRWKLVSSFQLVVSTDFWRYGDFPHPGYSFSLLWHNFDLCNHRIYERTV